MGLPPQLKRLIPLFILVTGLFLLIRHFLVPDSFGEFGHYRGDALLDIAAKEPVYADVNDCYACHDDIKEMVDNDVHAGISCLSCHGPGKAHVEDWEAEITKGSGREFCGRCHQFNPTKPIDVIFQVDIKTHHTEVDECVDCHNPHQVWEGLLE